MRVTNASAIIPWKYPTELVKLLFVWYACELIYSPDGLHFRVQSIWEIVCRCTAKNAPRIFTLVNTHATSCHIITTFGHQDWGLTKFETDFALENSSNLYADILGLLNGLLYALHHILDTFQAVTWNFSKTYIFRQTLIFEFSFWGRRRR